MKDLSQEPQRVLKSWDCVAITIAIVIGVGIFRVPADIARHLSSPSFILLAWFLGGLISLLGTLCYAELASSFPKTGGSYVYLKESYGPLTGFLFGWTELLVVRAGSNAAVAYILGDYLQSFLSLSESSVKPLAIGAILILSCINIAGLRHGKMVQDFFVAAKILTLAGIIVFGIFSGKGDASHFQSVGEPLTAGGLSLLGLALIPILWTYGGWHESTFVAGEIKDAGKTFPVALIAGILAVTALYMAINALYIFLVPVKEMAGTKLIAADVLQILCGDKGRKVLEILVILSSVGCLNASVITGSRVVYAMGRDNPFFAWLGMLSPKQGTPYSAIIINAVWASALILLETFEQLLFFTGIVVWIFFALAGAALYVLRHKYPNLARPYKVWGYPVTPAVFVAVSAALFANSMIYYPFQSLIGLGLLAAGIPVYLLSQRKKKSSFAV